MIIPGKCYRRFSDEKNLGFGTIIHSEFLFSFVFKLCFRQFVTLRQELQFLLTKRKILEARLKNFSVLVTMLNV